MVDALLTTPPYMTLITFCHGWAMARLAPLAQPTEQPLVLDESLVDDPLAGDHIGFDTWLLPPEEPGRAERAIRLCSTVAGPVVFTAALVGFVAWIA